MSVVAGDYMLMFFQAIQNGPSTFHRVQELRAEGIEPDVALDAANLYQDQISELEWRLDLHEIAAVAMYEGLRLF